MVAIAEPTTQAPPMLVETEAPPAPRNGANFVLNLEHLITEDDEPGELYPYKLNLEHLITEDDEPVDNIFSEKQQRLLTEPLYSSWAGPSENRPFIAAANVGVFYSIHRPAIVPDMFLSLEVQFFPDVWEKAGRSYLIWEHGKPPDLVIEVVSNTKGQENSKKIKDYARIGVKYYVVFDPDQQIQTEKLKVYELHGLVYVERSQTWFDSLELGLTLWSGNYENMTDTWLRWCDKSGQFIATGKEQAERAEQESQRAEQESQRADHERQRAEQESQRAEQESQRAEHETQRAEQESQRADHERQRAERLLAQLQALGIEPNNE